MGWKNVKEHYGIEHIVQVVPDKGICIGSGYVHDIIVIDKDLNIKRSEHIGRGEPFEGWVRAMESDKAQLRRLIETPDTFERSLIVHTADYHKGEIIEKRCEKLGWPNVTHDGECMYENSFSTDRAKIVAYAKSNAAAAIKSQRRIIEDSERELAKHRAYLAEYETAMAKLNRENPEELQ